MNEKNKNDNNVNQKKEIKFKRLAGLKKALLFWKKKRDKNDDVDNDEQKTEYDEKHVFTWHNFREYMKKEKEIYSKRFQALKSFLMEKPIKSSILLSFIMLVYVESMSRRSFGDAVIFAYSNIGRFLLNWLIVIAPFLLVFVISKRIATYVLVSVLWIVVGTVDFIMLSYRTTPFTGNDLQSVFSFSEMAIAFEYMGLFKSILLILAILLVIGMIVCLFLFTPKVQSKQPMWKRAVILVASWVAIYAAILIGIKTDIITTKFPHLATVYKEQGLPYCFTATLVDTGISKPSDYSEEAIDTIISSKNEKNEKKEKNKPNIIFLQLESFIDPKDIKGLKFSKEPVPYFTELRKKFSSGYFEVPTVVAGTCNTEFEVLTGMSLEFFGPGEYPYKTILKNNVCESMAFDMKKQGYKTHAVHNYLAGFYGRNNVYANLGFDTFTGLEMMSDIKRTANGRWVEDSVLPGCVKDCLDSTDGPDLLYTVSVQCHGAYDLDIPEGQKLIDVTGEEDKDLLKQINYFVNMEKQEDEFIKNLIKMLSDYKEDTILVMYGDHIPGLNLTDDNYKAGIYKTPYVIWDNMGLKKEDKDVKSYQMASEIFERIGLNNGTVFKYHQIADRNSDDYLTNLHQLQYDMLYGKKYVYKGKVPFEKTDIKYGVKDLKIDKVNYIEKDKKLYIEGKDFNGYTNVFIDGEKVDSNLVSSSLIQVDIDEDKLKDKIKEKEKEKEKNKDKEKETDSNSIKICLKYQNSDDFVYVESNEVECKLKNK